MSFVESIFHGSPDLHLAWGEQHHQRQLSRWGSFPRLRRQWIGQFSSVLTSNSCKHLTRANLAVLRNLGVHIGSGILDLNRWDCWPVLFRINTGCGLISALTLRNCQLIKLPIDFHCWIWYAHYVRSLATPKATGYRHSEIRCAKHLTKMAAKHSAFPHLAAVLLRDRVDMPTRQVALSLLNSC